MNALGALLRRLCGVGCVLAAFRALDGLTDPVAMVIALVILFCGFGLIVWTYDS